MTDPYLTGYGVSVAALRDDPEGIRVLFAGLTPEATAAVAECALRGLATALRGFLPADTINYMITAMQQCAAADAA